MYSTVTLRLFTVSVPSSACFTVSVTVLRGEPNRRRKLAWEHDVHIFPVACFIWRFCHIYIQKKHSVFSQFRIWTLQLLMKSRKRLAHDVLDIFATLTFRITSLSPSSEKLDWWLNVCSWGTTATTTYPLFPDRFRPCLVTSLTSLGTKWRHPLSCFRDFSQTSYLTQSWMRNWVNKTTTITTNRKHLPTSCQILHHSKTGHHITSHSAPHHNTFCACHTGIYHHITSHCCARPELVATSHHILQHTNIYHHITFCTKPQLTCHHIRTQSVPHQYRISSHDITFHARPRLKCHRIRTHFASHRNRSVHYILRHSTSHQTLTQLWWRL